MLCPKCGAQLPDNAQFCTGCGAQIYQYQSIQNQYYQQNPYGPNNQNPYYGPYGAPGVRITGREFDRHPAIKSCKSSITGSAVTIYICAGITFLVNVLISMNPYGMVDVLLLVGLGLGIHLGKSRACAIITCVYSAVNLLLMLLTTGSIGGWLILVASIYAIVATFKYQRAWKAYLNTGMLPNF